MRFSLELYGLTENNLVETVSLGDGTDAVLELYISGKEDKPCFYVRDFYKEISILNFESNTYNENNRNYLFCGDLKRIDYHFRYDYKDGQSVWKYMISKWNELSDIKIRKNKKQPDYLVAKENEFEPFGIYKYIENYEDLDVRIRFKMNGEEWKFYTPDGRNGIPHFYLVDLDDNVYIIKFESAEYMPNNEKKLPEDIKIQLVDYLNKESYEGSGRTNWEALASYWNALNEDKIKERKIPNYMEL